MSFNKLILTATLLLALSACARDNSGNLEVFCRGLDPLMNSHVDALVRNGEALVYGPGEILVTADELITVYDKSCENG